eukprot:CAMPEP_0169098440 /NCGR_PEP_ID=MMETSP1015-20121227/20043_1 /TAXON_ID=342587 /ORGANISM="Karlodinium micrum, Strain CCMP2283" /LENGTH=518 /DNA_ID=CAMNT_0009159291 /DNA_START=44 /DNA_END=1600 /DNA_ORIENTATION=-
MQQNTEQGTSVLRSLSNNVRRTHSDGYALAAKKCAIDGAENENAGEAVCRRKAGQLRRINTLPSCFVGQCAQLPIAVRGREENTASIHKEKLPDRFHLQAIVGQGSYGCVAEAYDKENFRMVAVKRVDNLFRDLVDCKRVLREITIMSKLQHPGVVQLFEIPQVSEISRFNELFIVMELCDSDMAKLLSAQVSLSTRHTTLLLYNLLLGLKYIHSAGIYHRDLKPANCLVNADCSVKICDFGLARSVDEGFIEEPIQEVAPAPIEEPLSPMSPVPRRNFESPERQRPGIGSPDRVVRRSPRKRFLKRRLTTHVATRWYRAPELCLLQEEYTAAVDIWSVGCIYAELLGMHESVKCEDRHPLFPGSSCFPLSPLHAHAKDYRYHTTAVQDQLNLIFNLLGTPRDEDMEFLDRDDARSYIRCFTKREGQGIRGMFEHVHEDAIAVLENVVRFNASTRPTVDELLDFQLFAEDRDPSKEVNADTKIDLDIEAANSLDELRLRSYFLKAIAGCSQRAAMGGA